jgi:hypothetical protein
MRKDDNYPMWEGITIGKEIPAKQVPSSAI